MNKNLKPNVIDIVSEDVTNQQNLQSQNQAEQVIVAIGLIVLLVFSRCTSHIWNFTAVGGIAIFSAAYFTKKITAFGVVAIGMIISDLVIGFHNQMLAVYGAYFLMILVGFTLTLNSSRANRFLFTFAASVLFFLVTNFAVWNAGVLYPLTAEGLKQSYIMGEPFFRSQILSDLLVSFVLFEVARLPATAALAVRLKLYLSKS